MGNREAPKRRASNGGDSPYRGPQLDPEWVEYARTHRDDPKVRADVRAVLEHLDLLREETTGAALALEELARAKHDDRSIADEQEIERLRPRRGAPPVPAGLREVPIGRRLAVVVEDPPRQVAVTPELARRAQALRSVIDVAAGEYVHPEIIEAVNAAAGALEDAWISVLVQFLVTASADRTQRERLPRDLPRHHAFRRSPSVTPAHVLRYVRADARPQPFAGLSAAPDWVTSDLVAWLLEHFSPGRGGRGKLNEATIRRLLENRHDLAKKIEPSDPALAAHVQAKT